MELLQLRYFVAAAREENVTRAAQKLHIAQPALSQSIARLEEEMGVRLFDRIGKRIRLNAAGRELLRTVEPILASLAAMPEKLQAIADEEAEIISLNVLAASHLITDLIISYRTTHPKTNFKMSRNVDSLDWDFRISSYPGGGEAKLPGGQGGRNKAEPQVGNDETKLLEEEIFLAVSLKSKYADRTEIELEEVSDEPFLTFPQNMPYHELCNRIWTETGISPRVGLESDNPQSLKELLSAGMGVAFWPQFSWGSPETEHVKLLHIARPKVSRAVTVTKNVKRRFTGSMEEFYQYMLEYFNAIAASEKRI